MKAFVLTPENLIVAFSSAAQLPSDSDQLETIKSEQAFAELASKWPAARLVAIWNNLPGTTRVTKFTDRKSGIARIWKAMQTLEPAVASVERDNASTKPGRAQRSARKQQADTGAAKRPSAQRTGERQTKSREVVDMLRRSTGVTLPELMEATGWQAHSVRGFLSGAIGKKMGLKVDSSKRPDGQRSYRIATE